jgi:RNA polymerase sigma-70 factor (ECF subfamily)
MDETRARVTSDEFAVEFKSSFLKLWLVASAIVRDRTLAEDVVQEAALVALDKLEQFKPGTSFVAWMSQIVRYVGLNKARAERVRRAEPTEPGRLNGLGATDRSVAAASPISREGRLDAHQTSFDDRVVESLNGLAETARACVLLRTVAELDYADIAKLLEIPAGTAMSHVHRARQQLRRALSSQVPGAAGGPS